MGTRVDQDLPCEGKWRYVAPKPDKVPRRLKWPRGAYVDADGNHWVKARAQHAGPHWDVVHPDGTHTNVTFDGRIIGGEGNSNFPREPSD
jgi:hypothetical protein